MNCTHPEELAVVNWPNSSVHDRVVTTKELIPPNTRFFFCGKQRCTVDGPAWWVESPAPVLSIHGPVSLFPVYDKHLRPIGTPEHGGVEESSFQKPLPTLAETITAALNRQKYGSRS